MPEKVYDIIIIGGGCAGLTAAVYARRAGKTVLIIEKEAFGGQISTAPNVENFPGFKSISGLEFSDRLLEQATELGADIELDTVKSVFVNEEIKTVNTEYGSFKGKAIIIATGVKHRKMELPKEGTLTGRGVSYCAVCDGTFYKNKEVAVYGGGNAALQEAIYLSNICSKVLLIHRREVFRGDASLVEQAKKCQNIEIKLNAVIKSLQGDSSLTGITVADKITGEETEINISGLFVSIGHVPNNDIFKDTVRLDEHGFIAAGEDCKTDVPGIFTAGDCRRKQFRQLTTAAADGSIAASEAAKYIDSL